MNEYHEKGGTSTWVSKIAAISSAFMIAGWENGFYIILITIPLDFILRMATAGFTFNYSDYPYNMSPSQYARSYWIGIFLSQLIATLIILS